MEIDSPKVFCHTLTTAAHAQKRVYHKSPSANAC